MKKIILNTLYVVNVAFVILTILLPIINLFGENDFYDFFVSSSGSILRSVLSFMVLFLWVYCIYVWSKFDKKAIRLVLLIFLSAFYIIFYYPRVMKNKWEQS